MARKPHHPPDPGRYAPPNDDTPGYLMGENAVAGFGSRRLFVAAIPRREAVETITSNHYSGRVVNNSYVHLGVYLAGEYVGAMQFGYMLNPHRAGRIVAGTHTHEYLELNRMWLSDVAPRNTESQALSCAIKYIRRALPRINWIQSYADERCGGCGIVYQACGFLYLGCHKTRFLELDGEWYHEMLLTAHQRNGQRGKYLNQEPTPGAKPHLPAVSLHPAAQAPMPKVSPVPDSVLPETGSVTTHRCGPSLRRRRHHRPRARFNPWGPLQLPDAHATKKSRSSPTHIGAQADGFSVRASDRLTPAPRDCPGPTSHRLHCDGRPRGASIHPVRLHVLGRARHQHQLPRRPPS